MEDSYTVHRRRKAAARKREKTPDPSSRNQQLVETSDDEEEARRAKMEQMAEDAERAELQEREKRSKNQEDSQQKIEERKKRNPAKLDEAANKKPIDEKKSSPQKESQARESDAKDKTTARLVKEELVNKVDNGSPMKSGEAVTKYQDAIPRSKDINSDTDQPVEPRKVERRLKKKSRERIERHGQLSDSSDLEEIENHPRRTKSPETGKIRMKKSSSKRINSNIEVGTKEAMEKSREKYSKQKFEGDDPVKPERRCSRVHSQTDDTDEDPKVTKSESFPRQTEEIMMKQSPLDVKKQIILLSDDSLIQDFAKAQEEYLKREKSILDPDTSDVFEDAQEETILRRRKFSMPLTESEQEAIEKSIERLKESENRKGWFSWLPFFGKKQDTKGGEQEKKHEQEQPEKIKPPKQEETTETEAIAKFLQVRLDQPGKVTFMDFLMAMKDVVQEFKAFVAQNPKEADIVRELRNRCMTELMLVMIYCGLGAFIFRFTEGAFETFYKCGVKRVKRDFLDSLWNYSHNLREDDWKSMARRKLMEFEEQLHTAHEAGVHTYSGQRSWSFLNAVVYCLTVITTIGYGHISPSTNTGRAITIVYAIFGIPMFLIILADFGKLFTRGIKFLWAFVRRLYYTGSCRKVRRTVPEVMKGVQLVYDLATFKRPSQINPEDIEEMQKQAQQPQTVLNLDGNVPDTPGTPAMSAFAIDDEFNLPISVAIFILLGYIFIGATLFCLSEGWGFFESFYFVFISMSTIGFGDYVPKHPIYMMCSIIYLVFGLALTSMCINVVQVMLSDSFRQASQKIGATIGFEIAEEDRSVKAAVPPSVEIADVHTTIKESDSEGKIAPKAKQEDNDVLEGKICLTVELED
ncbi:TWiK family of potassium channels protein 18 [Melipona quadrifasciata]|uniref:TWiK family of potassium channels protein 18 n=1 Tax=Melipona quadrifasciata TaxID=166423 RepID=A0A0N0U514_9HYME|nr:TWiK family of potassium channels protein 18 [Melipona quadrifasciata]